uniref:RING-type domain-containing protein n=1 Tax=Anopheles funestus TaxID=62324 RepID=A0A182R959_ANOFN
MDLVCPICSDLFVPCADVKITPCGHMFHNLCLSQWLERSETCPQCREQCTLTNLTKVYFNVTAYRDTALENLTSKIRELDQMFETFETEVKSEHKEIRKSLVKFEEDGLFNYTDLEYEVEKVQKNLGTVQKVVYSACIILFAYASLNIQQIVEYMVGL